MHLNGIKLLITLTSDCSTTLLARYWFFSFLYPICDFSRKNMLDMSLTILELAKVHPWIVQTYLSMLKFREIAKLIEEKNDIVQLFQLDVVVYVFLTAIARDLYNEKVG